MVHKPSQNSKRYISPAQTPKHYSGTLCSCSSRTYLTQLHSGILQTSLRRTSPRSGFPMTFKLVPCPANFLSGTNFIPKTSNIFPKTYTQKRKTIIRAIQENEGPKRLIDIIRIIPDISRNYFKSRSRRALFGGISLLGGFYVAQTISLSFGALGVNDVIASVVCVLLTEYVTRFYYSRPKVTFPIALLNNFKMGFTYGLFIDAFKLAS